MNASTVARSGANTIRRALSQAQQSAGPLWSKASITVTNPAVLTLDHSANPASGPAASSPLSRLAQTVYQASNHIRDSGIEQKRLSIVPYLVTGSKKSDSLRVAVMQSSTEASLGDTVTARLDNNVVWTTWAECVKGLDQLVHQGKVDPNLEISIWEPTDGALKFEDDTQAAETYCSLAIDFSAAEPDPDVRLGRVSTEDTASFISATRDFATTVEADRGHLVDDTWAQSGQ